jgi:hypothetical protein
MGLVCFGVRLVRLLGNGVDGVLYDLALTA